MKCTCGSKMIKFSHFSYDKEIITWKCPVGAGLFSNIKKCKTLDEVEFVVLYTKRISSKEDSYMIECTTIINRSRKEYKNFKIPVTGTIKKLIRDPNLSKSLIQVVQNLLIM